MSGAIAPEEVGLGGTTGAQTTPPPGPHRDEYDRLLDIVKQWDPDLAESFTAYLAGAVDRLHDPLVVALINGQRGLLRLIGRLENRQRQLTHIIYERLGMHAVSMNDGTVELKGANGVRFPEEPPYHVPRTAAAEPVGTQ